MLNYSITVRPIPSPVNGLKAFVDVVIDDFMVIKDFKIFESSRGELFVRPPSKPSKETDDNGTVKYIDTVNFIDGEKTKENGYKTPRQEEMFETILAEYNRLLGNGKGAQKSAAKTDTAKPATKKNPLWG